mmetsp:Transcript_43123/g.124693  ORF Transcript_43123/g.124693 Transcript_43123/m.124693 type:complete len:200 (-) Transcript_43123:841-1440(-)
MAAAAIAASSAPPSPPPAANLQISDNMGGAWRRAAPAGAIPGGGFLIPQSAILYTPVGAQTLWCIGRLPRLGVGAPGGRVGHRPAASAASGTALAIAPASASTPRPPPVAGAIDGTASDDGAPELPRTWSVCMPWCWTYRTCTPRREEDTDGNARPRKQSARGSSSLHWTIASLNNGVSLVMSSSNMSERGSSCSSLLP